MKLLCIDGHSILNRAFYGIKLLKTKSGLYTNAIYGFLNILFKIEDDVKPDAIAVCFDVSAPTFRHNKAYFYKGNRKSSPDELRQQLPILKELLGYLGYKIVEKAGYEADDIIGTLSKSCEKENNECIIVTGDRDNLQLISDKVKVRLANNKHGAVNANDIGINEFLEEYGFMPINLIDFKALSGDASDNIPGVTGVGEKTATDLIKKFGTLEKIYINIDSEDIKPSVRKKLISSKNNAYLSYFLATIFCDVPIDRNINSYKKGSIDQKNVLKMFKKLEMNSFIERFVDKKTLSSYCEDKNDELVSISIIDSLVFFNKEKPLYFFNYDEYFSISQNENIYIFKDNNLSNILTVLKDFKLIVFQSKPIYLSCFEQGININIDFDLSLAVYLDDFLDSKYDLDKLFNSYDINVNIDFSNYTEQKDLIKKHFMFCKACDILKNILFEKNLDKLYYEIELPLSNVLASMQYNGVLLDVHSLNQFGQNLDLKIEKLTNDIYDLAGEVFTINSPKQLSKILFEKLCLPTYKKNKTGYSTDSDTLEFLKDKHPIIDLIIEYRAYTKLKSTYVDGLIKTINPDDGRIHSTFNQIETRTGRISSVEPNIQNIPVKTSIGSEMRKFFVAQDGCVFVDADYSQIELRILACLSNDENMINAFKDGEDIHLNTASQVFNISKQEVTSSIRSAAKAVNFGIVYGMGAFSLSKDIKVSVKEASLYIENYLNTFHGVKNYMDKTINFAIENGYVTTLFGRRRSIPELKSTNKNIKELGKRIAMNTPIQGSAADIIKIAMINVFNRIQSEKLSAKLILQVHDELIVETPLNEVEKVKLILKEEMENAVDLSVDLVVDINVGKNWYISKG